MIIQEQFGFHVGTFDPHCIPKKSKPEPTAAESNFVGRKKPDKYHSPDYRAENVILSDSVQDAKRAEKHAMRACKPPQ